MQLIRFIITSTYVILPICALLEITNIKCTMTDKLYAEFEYCYIKSVNRTYKYLSVKVNLFKVPINNASVGVAIMKKANGYKPFLYNVTIDGCKFMRNQNNVLHKFMYSFIAEHSNFNHTCPYDHPVFVDKLDVGFLNNKLTKSIPLPAGEYAAFTSWYTYNVLRADVKVYVTLKNEL